jgi:alkylation response protein AidB-like acyl-CoA dehydrogenase
MGMRGTGSHDVEITNVFVSDAQVVIRLVKDGQFAGSVE